MGVRTRFTEQFGLDHPIALAPMAPAAGSDLATAVSEAGALGMLGGGMARRELFVGQSDLAAQADVGCGFVTWTLAEDPTLLDLALERHRRAMMLSFGDPYLFAARVKRAGVPLFCQVQTLDHTARAIEAGADVVVAQGTEAGGHGIDGLSTKTLVSMIADYLTKSAPHVLLLAAGGIADGRGLASALSLGADGALIGTRFWMSQEALVPRAAKEWALRASSSDTIRTRIYDIVRREEWPSVYTNRMLRNSFTAQWHGREEQLRRVQQDELRRVEDAVRSSDFDIASIAVGESIGLIDDIPTAADIVRKISSDANAILSSDFTA